MIRRAFTATLAFLACAAPAGAVVPRFLKETTPPQTLMPGVTYQRLVQFTSRGPVVYHVLTAPKPGGLYALKPVLSGSAIAGKARLTQIEQNVAQQATTAGINGDFFAADGRPSGILIRAGALDSAPLSTRSSIGLDAGGLLHVARIAYNGYWKGSGQRRRRGRLLQEPGHDGARRSGAGQEGQSGGEGAADHGTTPERG